MDCINHKTFPYNQFKKEKLQSILEFNIILKLLSPLYIVKVLNNLTKKKS